MLRASTHIRTVALVCCVLLGVVLVRLVEDRIFAQSAAADNKTKQLEVTQAEYQKILEALKAALPGNDTQLQRLIAIQTERTNALAEQLARARLNTPKSRASCRKKRKSSRPSSRRPCRMPR